MPKAAIIGCLILLVAKAQLTFPLIERPFLEEPPFIAKAFQLSSKQWAFCIRVRLEPWLDYAFDSTLPLRLRLYLEKALVAETLITAQAASSWEASFVWSFEGVGGQFYFLEVSAAEVEGLSQVSRVWLPPYKVKRWIASPESHLPPTLTVLSEGGKRDTISPASPLWPSVFVPALVDTSKPLPPHVLKKPREAITAMPCAWYVKGDSSQVFWSCAMTLSPYASGTSRWSWDPERAQRANLLFSSHKPGSRTDQGLLYIFLGPPALRLLEPTREVWVYPELSAAFTFLWNGRSWQLQRRLEYQNLWQRK